MPCSDGGPSHEQVLAEATRRREQRDAAKITVLEALLCSACRQLTLNGYDFGLNPGLDEWWAQHQQQDTLVERTALKARLRDERIAALSATPFADLTAEDKKFLKQEGLL